jgi:hypothetical protein
LLFSSRHLTRPAQQPDNAEEPDGHPVSEPGRVHALSGEEVLRSQRGNNCYCQDNELSWFNWKAPESGPDMLRFVRELSDGAIVAPDRVHRAGQSA